MAHGTTVCEIHNTVLSRCRCPSKDIYKAPCNQNCKYFGNKSEGCPCPSKCDYNWAEDCCSQTCHCWEAEDAQSGSSCSTVVPDNSGTSVPSGDPGMVDQRWSSGERHNPNCKTSGIRGELKRRLLENEISMDKWIDLMEEVIDMCECKKPKWNSWDR